MGSTEARSLSKGSDMPKKKKKRKPSIVHDYIKYWYMAECVNVVDGDTYDLYIDQGMKSGREERVRLFGFNTPEINSKKDSDEYKRGMEAMARVEDLILGREDLIVQTIKDTEGKYGRYLVRILFEVIPGEPRSLADLGTLLVNEGHAEVKNY